MKINRLDQVRGYPRKISWRYIVPMWFGSNCVRKAIFRLEKAGFQFNYRIAKRNIKEKGVKEGDSIFDIIGPPDREGEVSRIMLDIRPDKKEKEEFI